MHLSALGRKVGKKRRTHSNHIKVARSYVAYHHLIVFSFLLLFRVRVALQYFHLLSVDRSTLLDRGTRHPVYRFLTLALLLHFTFTITYYRQADTMASTMRSAFAKVLVAAVAISSVGVAMAQAPAPGPSGETSAAAGLLPATIMTSLIVAVSGFVAARCL